MRGCGSSLPLSAAFILVFSAAVIDAFAPTPRHVIGTVSTTGQNERSEWRLYESTPSDNSGPNLNCDDYESASDIHRIGRLRGMATSLMQKSKPVALALVSAAAFGQKTIFRPPAAEASAPIVLRAAKKKDDPPMVQAATKAEELKKQRRIEEFDRFMEKCNDIEEKEGKKARDDYEAKYQADKQAKEAQKAIDLETLKRELLDQGQDPSTDLDAERTVWLFEHDIDLEKVPGTPHNERMIKNFQSRGKNIRTYASQRYIVKCQVADLKARGIDPMEHFAQPEVIEKSRAIYKMDDKVAAKVATQYEGLMEQYGGRLTPPQEGEVPFVYQSAEKVSNAATAAIAATPSKSEAAAEKAKAKEERAAAKAEANAKRTMEKAQAKKEKAAQKQARADARAEAKAAKLEKAAMESASQEASDSEMAATAGMDFAATAGVEASVEDTVSDSSSSASLEVSSTEDSMNIMDTIKSKANAKNAATVVVAGGVAVYGYNYVTENSASAQAERERQLKLIMGASDDDDEDDEFDDDDDDYFEPVTKSKATQPSPTPAAPKPKVAPVPAPVPAPKPKRRLGIFNKSKDARETDINALFAPGAQAPEFAALLAKILTFGAPGRFPVISSMSNMPFKEFDLDTAKEVLTQARSDADLADEQSAETFASVVNCMIIDIIDLASATVKGKDSDDKVTVDAIGVVMDFMDHAASLFDAVASDVTIKPVTYGGSLRKKDLEKMFSIYAGSSLMSLDGSVSQDRVDTLQLVFGITDKKAEGLMQKHMMKMMMNLMKDGGKGLEGMEGMPGMEGMEDMMSALGGGGMPGMPGMPGMDGEMSPEDLKQTVGMMKELMDSGAVSEEELAEVRNQFKEMYGSDIADLIKKADEEGAGEAMSDDEKALLDMFKQILGE